MTVPERGKFLLEQSRWLIEKHEAESLTKAEWMEARHWRGARLGGDG